MIKCIHFTPVDGLGGVECAARSCAVAEDLLEDVDVRLIFISGWISFQEKNNQPLGNVLAFTINTSETIRAQINNPLAHLWVLFKIMQEKPDVLVCSLWRSMFVGIVYKLLFPKVKFVCFLHSAVTVRFIDRFLNTLAMSFADAIWADSQQTLTARVPERFQTCKLLRVISFIVKKIVPQRLPVNSPVFVCWGRLDYLKGIDRALRFFASIHTAQPEASFYIYGPDGGEASNFQRLANDLDVSSSVHFMGARPFEEIQAVASNYSYYLLLSRKEGMAMSVVEAMQLGLVPIVAPIGEIANYCQNNVNAVVVDDLNEAPRRVLALLEDTDRYCELQKNAIGHWGSSRLYKEDFAAAVRELCVE